MFKIVFQLLFFPLLLSAQLDKAFNKKIGITEDLSSKEIRVYKKADITNSVSLFRLYQNDELVWKSEYYECHFILQEDGGDDFRKIEITSSKELSYVWLEILNSDILYLPEQAVFKYKLKGKAKIKTIDGKYESQASIMAVLDGESYAVQIRAGDKKNSFEYDNPKMYLKYYPKVDELQSFIDLLKVLKNRFAISI